MIFDLKEIEKEFEIAEVQEMDDAKIKVVFLGTVFTLLPSGKFYMPYAHGNVTEKEAEKDQEWYEDAEKELETINASLEPGEDDPCDLFAVKVMEE